MKKVATLMTLLCLLTSCAVHRQPDNALTATPRTDQLLSDNWSFLRSDAPNAQQPDFDPSKWQTVALPHTWNNLDAQDGGSNYYRGPAWYRRQLKLKPLPGKSYFLKFEGAATVAEVFLNGKSVGTHSGNFSAFCLDITTALNPTGNNLLAVRVDNALDKNVPPISGDFNICGGLYRPVHLLTLDALSVSPLDFASPGVYLKQTKVTREQADVDITIKLRNGNSDSKTAAISVALLDDHGTELQRALTAKDLTPAASGETAVRLTIPSPHLWNGQEDAYLYHVAVEVRDGPTLVDRVVQPLGLRFFSVDPQQGFFLNGIHFALHGVNRHQDRIDKGWAISNTDHEEDFKLIQEMGCTGIRLSHYEHAQFFYDLCDRGGMVVWAEIPLVDAITDSPEFTTNAHLQLTELIKQSCNHPSICFWGLFNEVRYTPENSMSAKSIALIKELNTLSHTLDPTRPTTCATDRPYEHPINSVTDLLGMNWYYGWYAQFPGGWKAAVDRIEANHGTRSVGFSEYGAGSSVYQHEIPPVKPATVSRWHPEEWQLQIHEEAWAAMKNRPWIWGTFLWNMFDFAIDTRKEGDTLGRNDKGMITYDRKTKKDVFYFYQANWTTKPMVHITSQRFTPRQVGPYPIKVYSNCDAVELILNGKSLGTRQNPDHIFVWNDAPWQLGPNKIEAMGTQSGAQTREECTITIDPSTPATKPAS